MVSSVAPRRCKDWWSVSLAFDALRRQLFLSRSVIRRRFSRLLAPPTCYVSPVLSHLSHHCTRRQDVCRGLESGGDDISKLQTTASGLLASHLEGYINQQLRHLASRHQVSRNYEPLLNLVISTYESEI